MEEPKPGTSSGATSSTPNGATNNASEPKDIKPVITGTPGTSGTATTSTATPGKPGATTTTTPASRPRAYNRSQVSRTQIMPRLSLLDDEDDGLTCRLCLQPFWYKARLIDHLKETHSIAEPIEVRI